VTNRSRPTRFEVHEHDGKIFVDDDDFGYDALLMIQGDFVDDEKRAFAQAVADVLNENEGRIPVAGNRS
jgi:hypothetical protein